MPRNLQGNSYNKNEHLPQKSVKPANLGIKGVLVTPKEPLKCSECGEPHLRINFPRFNGESKMLHNIQEASTVGEIGKNYHIINASLKDQQAYHHSAIMEIEGAISNHILAMLIDPGATLSYITPRMMELCQLTKVKNVKP